MHFIMSFSETWKDENELRETTSWDQRFAVDFESIKEIVNTVEGYRKYNESKEMPTVVHGTVLFINNDGTDSVLFHF